MAKEYQGGMELELVTERPAPLSVRMGERFFRNKKIQRRGAGVLAIVMLAAWTTDKGEPGEDSCTDIRQQLVQVGATDTVSAKGDVLKVKNTMRSVLDGVGMLNDSRTISGVAEELSWQRGYYVSPEQLAAVNKGAEFIQRDENGELKDSMPVEMSDNGTYCVRVPGPIYGGFDVVEDEGETFASVASKEDMNVALLQRFNPHLKTKKKDDVLPVGTTLRTDDVIDPTLVYRPMKEENINSMGDAKLRHKIILANIALMSADNAPDATGDTGYFPLVGGSDTVGEKQFTAQQILAAYNPNAAPIIVEDSQIDQKTKEKPKAPKDKPKPPKKKPNTPPPESDRRAINNIEVGPTVGYTTNGTAIPRSIGRVIYYNQSDRRWARDDYSYEDNGKTIQTSGCGPTTLAMVISTLSSNKNVRPDQLAPLTKRLGYRAPKGTSHGAFTTIPERYGLESTKIKKNLSSIRAVLNKGGLVIVNGLDQRRDTPATDGGHIYLIQGITDKGQLVVADPNIGGVKKSLRTWAPKDILGPASAAFAITK